jgi:hypothetical protein
MRGAKNGSLPSREMTQILGSQLFVVLRIFTRQSTTVPGENYPEAARKEPNHAR